MGIYLGQLPPAEIARLKAELAETLITNFCYPRFFDHRTDSLQMRPVDRSKRQEVWLYLSSVDFTAWGRVDLMSPDLQNQIERLFIQFVQRNRSFFGHQGRRRMSDIRMLINMCATSVSQRLRNHLTGQKQMNPPFGSPRTVVTWSATSISGRSEPSWEQISVSTMQLQQQLQEMRGESKLALANDARTANPTGPLGGSNGVVARRSTRPQPTISPSGSNGHDAKVAQQATLPTAPVKPQPTPSVVPGQNVRSAPAAQMPVAPASAPLSQPATPMYPADPAGVSRRPEPLAQPADQPAAARRPEALPRPVEPASTPRRVEPVEQPLPLKQAGSPARTTPLPETPSHSAASSNGVQRISQAMPASQTSSNITASTTTGQREMLSIGEDDIAIFEQLRHQLVLWLRVEALTSGLEISTQAPAQLLDLLRQQARLDETRLQVVSTLLNLSNQVIKTGVVSVLDYKQALMFHLMHTKR